MWWVLPAMIGVLVAASGQPPRTLAEAAARAAQLRRLAPAAVRSVTDLDVPRAAVVEPPPPPAAGAAEATAGAGSAGTDAKPPATPEHNEAWWRDRMTTARTALDRDQMLSDGLQSKLNALAADIVNRDDPAQRARLMDEQQRTQAEWERMRKQVESDRQQIAAIEEEARVARVPPGWIR